MQDPDLSAAWWSAHAEPGTMPKAHTRPTAINAARMDVLLLCCRLTAARAPGSIPRRLLHALPGRQSRALRCHHRYCFGNGATLADPRRVDRIPAPRVDPRHPVA